MTQLPYGELPTAAALHSAAQIAGTTAASVLDVCRRSMAVDGPNEGVRQLLRALGFDWAKPVSCGCGSVPCMCTDLAAVAEALDKEAP